MGQNHTPWSGTYLPVYGLYKGATAPPPPLETRLVASENNHNKNGVLLEASLMKWGLQ